MTDRLFETFYNSFLQPLLKKEDITDITYNGENIYYQTNMHGRKKSSIKVSNQEIQDFIRQLANLSEKMFSISNPILDISIRNYRLNAVHTHISRKRNQKCITFAIRKASINTNATCIINNLDEKIRQFLINLLQLNKSILICGETGSGKTEFQKYLISLLKDKSRIIIIDNVQELENIDDSRLDITHWQVDENDQNSLDTLIKNSLRFNPDWTIIAEARGEEMSSILNSVMTGHPIITTLHCLDLSLLPSRVLHMIKLKKSTNYDESTLREDIYQAFNIGIHLRKIEVDGMVIRYVDEIREYLPTLEDKVIYQDHRVTKLIFPCSKGLEEQLGRLKESKKIC